MEILLNPKTSQSITNILSTPQHTVGIQASNGAGKGSVAKYIANNIIEKYGSSHSFISINQPIDKKYSISQIRQIISSINLKPSKPDTISQIIILEDFDLMTAQTQNLFLKPIEESNTGVMFILTYSDKQKILPTILSRIKILTIEKTTFNEVYAFFEKSYSKKDITTAYNIASGKVGLICSLLHNKQDPLLEEIEISKNFIKSDKFNKLIITNQLAKKDISLFLEALALVADYGLKSALDKNLKEIKKWHNLRKNILFAKSLQTANCNTKLILTYLSINIV